MATSTFFTEPFTDYLESLVMSSEPLIILGDFNIRMDLLPVGYTGVDGSQAACLSTTHELGHTLDLITTRIHLITSLLLALVLVSYSSNIFQSSAK